MGHLREQLIGDDTVGKVPNIARALHRRLSCRASAACITTQRPALLGACGADSYGGEARHV